MTSSRAVVPPTGSYADLRGKTVVDEDVVEAVVAAGHDRDVGLGKLDHRHRVVDRRVRDLMVAFGEAVAQHVGVRRVQDLDR
jgi:hypothetical protein